MTDNCTHFCKGKFLKVALILGTPGKEEEFNNFPVPGRIRKNLAVMLEKLRTKDYFSEYEDIYEFRITYASTTIYNYKSRSKKEKAIEMEIASENNQNRLFDEISDINEIIICFGNSAWSAIELLKHKLAGNVKIVKVLNLSPVAFNSIKPVSGYPDKIDYLCENLIMQINGQSLTTS